MVFPSLPVGSPLRIPVKFCKDLQCRPCVYFTETKALPQNTPCLLYQSPSQWSSWFSQILFTPVNQFTEIIRLNGYSRNPSGHWGSAPLLYCPGISCVYEAPLSRVGPLSHRDDDGLHWCPAFIFIDLSSAKQLVKADAWAGCAPGDRKASPHMVLSTDSRQHPGPPVAPPFYGQDFRPTGAQAVFASPPPVVSNIFQGLSQ